ncbi:uncharacterized protein LOC114264737, partial [Camellia sinensis]|uniref:uncharacterized protein LOC114264737 n=1 Tax=Camellia sinensis TaxID=4442 RepID=UPI001035976D
MQRKIEEAEKRLKMTMPKRVPLPPSTQSTSTGSRALDTGGFRMEGYEPRKRKATGTSALEKAFNPVIWEQLHSEIARMFYSAGLPFHLSRNPYYVSAFQFVANNPIPGYVPPGYNLLRTTLLQKERANVERLLEPTRASWKEKGLSIVSDGWTNSQRRPLINFMGASEAGAVFLKTVNCEAGLLIESKYPNIFWTPCVVHTLNLALKNICAPKETGGTAFAYDECHWITLCVDDVMFIKNFIMNHSMRLAFFNEFVPLKLLAVADTRFASAIVMLKRFKLIKCGLQSMVISDQWVSYKEDDVGKAASVKEKLLNDVWWDKYYSSTWLDENTNRVPPHRDEEISSMRNKCFKKYFPNLEERRVVNVEYAKFLGGLDMFGDFDSKIDRG